MRKNFGVKAWVYPEPVFIVGTYDKNGKANAMNAAWGGISEENQLMICMGENHKTSQNLIDSQAFTVSMATVDTMVACDYVGVVSGKDADNKMEKAGFTTTKSEFVNAPIINELPMTIECKLISYNTETCMLLGEIINISADESILDADGKIDVDKLKPITYDSVHHKYRAIGEVVGNAFSDGLKLK